MTVAVVDQLNYSISIFGWNEREKKATEKGTMKKDYGKDSKSFFSVVLGHSLRPLFDIRVNCVCVCVSVYV